MKNKNEMKEIYVIVNDVRSNFNVGSIFRTAECAGVKKIFLAGITPAPQDRFGRENKELKKVALGADKIILWEKVSSVSRLVSSLKEEGFQIVSLEQFSDSIDYKKFKSKSKLALIVGNEVKGLPEKILKISDAVIEIPMRGEKESLNVSVAFGIAVFKLIEN